MCHSSKRNFVTKRPAARPGKGDLAKKGRGVGGWVERLMAFSCLYDTSTAVL